MSIVLDIDKLEAEKKKTNSKDWRKFKLDYKLGNNKLSIFIDGKPIAPGEFIKLPDEKRPTSPKYKGQTRNHSMQGLKYLTMEFKPGDKIAIATKIKKSSKPALSLKVAFTPSKKVIGTWQVPKGFRLSSPKASINTSDISA